MVCGVSLLVFPQILRLDLRSERPYHFILTSTQLKISLTRSINQNCQENTTQPLQRENVPPVYHGRTPQIASQP